MTVTGAVTSASPGRWAVGTVDVTAEDLARITAEDWDGDGQLESVSLELDGLVATRVEATLAYYGEPGFTVVGLTVD